MAKKEFGIFKANRIGFQQMRNDIFSYIREVYSSKGTELTMASPFAQILNVIAHLGRMILFYIENMITELNINTAIRPRNVAGLITLTGHRPSRGIGARGSLYMSYNMDSKYSGQNVTIKNHTKVINTTNGLTYTIILPSPSMQLTVGAYDSRIELPIIQGIVKRQQATGTGEALQSFNFYNKESSVVDEFFVAVYVNGTRWRTVDSMLDMGFEEEACVVRSSVNGGIDVYFGTGNSGAVPPIGAAIVCEYMMTNGPYGNVTEIGEENQWVFSDYGYDVDGEYVNLNEMYVLTSASEILFGTAPETIDVSKRLAPNMSRSFVLANATNYKCFLSKLNMFSVIDAFSGFGTYDDMVAEDAYTTAKTKYMSAKETYRTQCELTGRDSQQAEEFREAMVSAKSEMEVAKAKYEDMKMDDNVVYLYLLPDVSKRFSGNENYFTCPIDRFSLSDDEKSGLLKLIDSSGQRIMTAENRILDPTFVRFAMNIFVRIWDGYTFSSVKSGIITAVSSYLTSGTRRDRIPVSDIIKVVEGVDGVDSVTVFFDADRRNAEFFGKGNYGIDGYGDITLSRNVTDRLGNSVEVKDLVPLFRGGFVSPEGVEYEDDIDALVCPINITLKGTTLRS